MSKEIPLSQGKVAIVDDEDYEHVSRFKWTAAKRGKTWYACHFCYLGRFSNGQQLLGSMLLHRYLMRPPGSLQIDHKNHDGLNCHRQNMRIATPQQNNANQKPRNRGFKGVRWIRERKRWRSEIRFNRKTIFLGHFDSPVRAAKAYDRAAKKYFGEFACTNF